MEQSVKVVGKTVNMVSTSKGIIPIFGIVRSTHK